MAASAPSVLNAGCDPMPKVLAVQFCLLLKGHSTCRREDRL